MRKIVDQYNTGVDIRDGFDELLEDVITDVSASMPSITKNFLKYLSEQVSEMIAFEMEQIQAKRGLEDPDEKEEKEETSKNIATSIIKDIINNIAKDEKLTERGSDMSIIIDKVSKTLKKKSMADITEIIKNRIAGRNAKKEVNKVKKEVLKELKTKHIVDSEVKNLVSDIIEKIIDNITEDPEDVKEDVEEDVKEESEEEEEPIEQKQTFSINTKQNKKIKSILEDVVQLDQSGSEFKKGSNKRIWVLVKPNSVSYGNHNDLSKHYRKNLTGFKSKDFRGKTGPGSWSDGKNNKLYLLNKDNYKELYKSDKGKYKVPDMNNPMRELYDHIV